MINRLKSFTDADSYGKTNTASLTHSYDERHAEDTPTGLIHFMKRHALLVKCVSLILAAVFFEQTIGWSQEGRPVWSQAQPFDEVYSPHMRIGGIEVPYDLGEAHDFGAGEAEETIIHIQDAHASLSAQHSIASLLDTLVASYDIRTIALEGGAGFIDTSLLRTFPDKDVRDGAAEHLMKEGLMSAGEFYAITRDEAEVTLYGVEDYELYQKNLESFRNVAIRRTEYVDSIDALLEQLKEIGERVYSPELNSLNIDAALHRRGKLGFQDYWVKVDELAESRGVSPEKGGDLEKLVEAVRIEKDIDFAAANFERRSLIDEVTPMMDRAGLEQLVSRSVSFKQNKISQSDFHLYLISLAEEHKVDAEGYANLIKFTRYITIYESIDLIRLFSEMEKFEDRIRETLYRNDDERRVNDIARLAGLLRNLYSMELTNGEGMYLRSRQADMDAPQWSSVIREVAGRYNVPISGGYDLGFITGGFEDAMRFYEDAEARDNAMIENTIRRMRADGTRVAALITGGYHTEGLKDLMKHNKLSYLIIMPKYESDEERPYISVLTNRKGEYQQLMDAGRYQLAVQLFFQRGVSEMA